QRTSMKRQQNNSARASALQVALSVILISAFAILLASSFEAAISPRQSAAATSTRSETPRSQAGQLSFADRVAYQRAIEDVYWRHRIWAKENQGAKPSLDAVMSQAQIEMKVGDYLRSSRALELNWQHPIATEELQAELDRIAQNTRQPET